jgi:hypothetical protein
VTEHRPKNSERRLERLVENEPEQDELRGILEIFDRDEDAALAREADDDDE